MSEFIDLPVKACHGAQGTCHQSYTLREWERLAKVGERGPDEVRQCSLCGQLLFLDKTGLEALDLKVTREKMADMHPDSRRPFTEEASDA
jgi:hypothetical protein